jgi:hypothetical protein
LEAVLKIGCRGTSDEEAVGIMVFGQMDGRGHEAGIVKTLSQSVGCLLARTVVIRIERDEDMATREIAQL